jgi:hypothetical protein
MLEAKNVLDRAENAVNALKAGDASNWESLWVDAVVSLRAVGHILKKTDSKASNIAKRVIEEHWQRWNSGCKDCDESDCEDCGTWIFKEFIEYRRNSLLKENEGMPACSVKTYGDHSEHVEVTLTLDDGRDGVYMLEYALSWLERELDEIENEIIENEIDAEADM